MGNIFKFFLFTSILVILIGCEKQTNQISCDELLEQAYEESTLNNFEKNKFKDLFLNRYPEFDSMFEEAAQETGIEKNLLAAISFQESQWDPRAKSNMGVRGMMMVTLETAAIVGVKNRLDPEQSINGGSKYIASLLEKNIFGKSQSDQLAISLASYNLGPTNIINIAQTIDKEPDQMIWEDFESVLKNLSGEDVNLVDKNGYKRGQQAIDYVHRVEDYYKLMIAYSCKDPIYQSSFL